MIKSIIIVFVILLNTTYEREVLENNTINWNEISEQYKIERIERQISVLDIYNRSSRELVLAIKKASSVYNVPSELIVALIYNESSFRKYAVSHANCFGYMQINPVYWQVEMDKIFETEYNVMKGTKILKYYIDKYNTLESALMAYNGYYRTNPFGRIVLNTKEKIQERS